MLDRVVEYNGMLLSYRIGVEYAEFCSMNPELETRVEWDETTSDAMDAYYYCKEKYPNVLGISDEVWSEIWEDSGRKGL